MSIIDNLPVYAPEDFKTVAPYKFINDIRDPFQRRIAINELNGMAKFQSKIQGFMAMLQDYLKSLRTNHDTVYIDNVTTFQGQPIELNAGDWEVSESGISRQTEAVTRWPASTLSSLLSGTSMSIPASKN